MVQRGILAAGALLGAFFLLSTTVADGLMVWVVPSLQRVRQDDPAGQNAVAEIEAARGEYESFQIVIQAPASGQLTNVDVSMAGLSTPDGQFIDRSNFTLYREQYVHVRTGSPDRGGANRPLGPGLYPDALIPFSDPQTGQPLSGAPLTAAPFSVAPGKNQPIWVDIFVPREAAAGAYDGAFTVTSDQGSFTGRVSLQVWDFTLPPRSTLKSSFLLFTATDTASVQELLRNKVNPSKVPLADERDLIERFGLASTDLGFWSGADVSRCAMASAPPIEDLRTAVATHAPDLFFYNYTADEVGRCPSLIAPLIQWASNLHAVGAKNLVTMPPTAGLLDDGSGTGRSAVDIWVLLPVLYDENADRVHAVQQKGDEVWSYNALVQDNYSPKWLIDFDPVNFRIQPGFISQSLGLTGILYWRVDLWSSDPWNEVNSTGFLNYPGEGMLVYPGQAVGIPGVAPSMRLKWLRDGVEDYEYVELLKKAGQGSLALQVAREAGSDWSHWTRDPAQLAAARRRLGIELSRAQSIVRQTESVPGRRALP